MAAALQQQNFSLDEDAPRDCSASSPMTSGRRRNRVAAAQKRDRAIQLIADGHTYEEVAKTLGYANRGTVHHIVHGALAKHEALSAEKMRARQGARLDVLLAAVWDR